jgi:hypothetical protein
MDFKFTEGDFLNTKKEVRLTNREREFLRNTDPSFLDFEKYEKMVWTRSFYAPAKDKKNNVVFDKNSYTHLQPNYRELFEELNRALHIYKKQANLQEAVGDSIGFD